MEASRSSKTCSLQPHPVTAPPLNLRQLMKSFPVSFSLGSSRLDKVHSLLCPSLVPSGARATQLSSNTVLPAPSEVLIPQVGCVCARTVCVCVLHT